MRHLALALVALVSACGPASPRAETPADRSAHMPETSSATFGSDLTFLEAHLPDLVVLSRGEMRVAVAPAYQGRVMTSSARGEAGASCGWIHRALIESGELRPHMNAFGGEDRFWLGPEGGPFGLYFPPGAPFDLEHWQVPAAIDTDAWEVGARTEEEVAFRHDVEVVNASRTRFSLRVDRRVRLLSDAEIDPVRAGASAVDVVAYESVNAITNTGEAPWRAETGLLSIWILSMYPPSPSATVVIPFRTADADGAPLSGPVVNDAYFGELPSERLRVDATAGVLFFRADGLRRGKIGVPRARALPILGAWDPERGVLTLVRYTLPPEGPTGYVNSMWEQEDAPYAGDVVNSYNDGPPAPGEPPLGPFFELESSSPAAALAPGERLEHTHTTFHFEGARGDLDRVATEALGVGLDAIERALPSP